jgi:hypothetical protein
MLTLQVDDPHQKAVRLAHHSLIDCGNNRLEFPYTADSVA